MNKTEYYREVLAGPYKGCLVRVILRDNGRLPLGKIRTKEGYTLYTVLYLNEFKI